MNLANKKCLNSFTILSYNPNNVVVTFNAETYFLDKQNNDDNLIINNNNNDENNETEENVQSEYWIVNENGENKIKINVNNNLIIEDQNIKAGPLFSMDLAILYLNYFNDMGL